jgi:hypothetical protein
VVHADGGQHQVNRLVVEGQVGYIGDLEADRAGPRSRSGISRGGGASDHLCREIDAGHRQVGGLGRNEQRQRAGAGPDVEHRCAGWQPGGGNVGDNPPVQRLGEGAGPTLVVAGMTSQPVHVGAVVRVVV